MTYKSEIIDSTVHLVVSKPPDSYLGGPPRIQKCGPPSHILHIFCLFFAIFFTSSSGMRKIFWGKYNIINVLKSASELWEMNDNISVGNKKIDFFGLGSLAPPPTEHFTVKPKLYALSRNQMLWDRASAFLFSSDIVNLGCILVKIET